ncbi:hypothetical protein ACPPVU_25485 [Mucilaginibacter sp. McL0603]|uniref:hypothetical protein n=1 Tax=Mucilaginibacter sp. McL0603 TaxID=3415670 RepID=UPI003CE69BD1
MEYSGTITKRYVKFVLFSLLVIVTSCQRDKEITRLLNSNKPGEIIQGTYEAGMSGDKKYVPLLLKDADNPAVSTALHFKGFSVYTEKMYALERILHVKPPHPYNGILVIPDSVNIKFYNNYWRSINKR